MCGKIVASVSDSIFFVNKNCTRRNLPPRHEMIFRFLFDYSGCPLIIVVPAVDLKKTDKKPCKNVHDFRASALPEAVKSIFKM